jgi:hypothetical protein
MRLRGLLATAVLGLAAGSAGAAHHRWHWQNRAAIAR